MDRSKKRIELHCHSKSGGNSTMYPGEIIRYLSESGMPAFAITDESNINAYPEFESVWETGNYITRPVYGMEMQIEGLAEGETDSISILVKNEIGKKALYRLISDNESVDPYPVFAYEKIVRSREGFLLGSGTEKGRVYKLAKGDASDAELKKEIKRYDYIELLPDMQFVALNKRIIRLCEELNIPAVAISDARYCNDVGKRAMRIMQHWNKADTCFADRHFWSTEEMLGAFDYLTEEKAYEIVVENTHLIAGMCETVAICPREKCYPNIKNAGERLQEICYKKLEEKYSEDISIAKGRLDWELDALEKTGMEFYVLQINELLGRAGLKADDISLRGASAGSMVAYLLDITSIDPLKYGLEPEFVFSNKKNREIDIDINLPADDSLDVISKVDSLEGIGKYVWAGTIQSVTESLAQAMIEKYLEDSDVLYDDVPVDKLRWLISGNYLGRGRHPGGIVVFPEGCEYKDLTPTTKVPEGFEVTYFDYHSIDRAFVKYDLLKHIAPAMLIKLGKLTGTDLSSIPVDSAEVLQLFEADEDGRVTACSDLPEFKSEYVRDIIAILKPKTFDDLVKISAISHGTGTWEDNGAVLVQEKGIGIKDIIATRDDVFEYNLSLGLDRDTSFEIAEAVRKGIVSRGRNAKWQSWKKELIEAGAPEWYIWSCEQILYLFPRAHAVSYLFMSMKLGWFKIHYPSEFRAVMKEYEELN